MAESIPVAVYVRASSVEQVASCPDQLAALRVAAEDRGYRIVREYIDDGVSGSREIEKRISFHQLIADSYKGEFSRVFVWDTSRFGRLDSQTAGEYKVKLRKNGVHILDSYSEGVIDWSTQMGRLHDALMSEANHEYALKLSKSTIRGRISKFEQGIYPHGMVPYGYDKEYSGNDQVILIPREKVFRAPKGWTRRLVINDAEAKVVRLVYELFVVKGRSILSIVKHLQRTTPPAWGGLPWSWNSVDKILRDKAYIGYAVMHKNDVRRQRSEVHNRMPTQEIPGVVPPILDDQLWLDAQAMQRQIPGGKRVKSTSNLALAGVMFCGHCGYVLTARTRGGNHYACSSVIRLATACPQWRAWESEILPVVIKKLVETVDAEVLSHLIPSDPGQSTVTPIDPLVKEVDDLRTKVNKAILRTAAIDDDLLADYQEVVRGMKTQLEQAEQKLRMRRVVDADGGPAVWSDWWAELRPGLVLASGDPELIADIEAVTAQYPVMRTIQGQGGLAQYRDAVRGKLIRLAADGNPDPLATILPAMVIGEADGSLVDADTLRGVLRRLGCSVSLWWKANPDKKLSRDPRWILDRGSIKINFRWSDPEHTVSTTTSGGGS